MIFADRYLLLIALLTVLLNIVNTSGEYLFGRYVVEAADGRTARAGGERPASSSSAAPTAACSATSTCSASSCRCSWSRGCSSSLASASRCSSTRLVALAGYLMMLRAPSITTMGYAEDRRQQPRLLARQHDQAGAVAADQPRSQVQGQAGRRFVLRAAGDVVQAGLVFIGERLALAVPAFALINVVLVGGWLGVVTLLNRQLRVKAEQAGESQL